VLAGPRRFRLIAAAAALVVVAAAVFALLRGAGEATVVVEPAAGAGPAFNVRHGAGLERVDARRGELLRLTGRRGEVFAVRPLRLPAYRGVETAILPLVADRVARAELPRRFADVEVVDTGPARINTAPGHEVVFRARRDGERVYGRVVFLLPPEQPGAREGLRLDVLTPRSPAVPSAGAVGTTGQLKRPFRTLRFGTNGP